jgi:sulfoxide reductase heme-binding subunit YedZ
MRSLLLHPLAKPLVFVLCLLPLAWFVYGAVANQLGANPAEALIRGLGDWSLRFLCVALAVTPLRIHTRTPQLARYRRMLGLYVFFYVCLHLLAYGWLDMGLDVAEIGRDIFKRPFILVGFAAWLLLLPLALTSTNGMVRRLGGKAWLALHRLVYGVVPLALLHFFWMRAGKQDFAEVAVYALILGALLLERLSRYFKPKPAPSPVR